MNGRCRKLLPALAATAALAALGCGGSDEPEGEDLPRATVAQLETRLDEIDRRYNDARDNDNPGACADIERDSFRAIERILGEIPDDVDPDLREAVDDSFSRLRELTADGCAGVEPPQTETTPPETETQEIPPPAPPPQTEVPPETDPAPKDEEKPDKDDGNGNGNGNNGNGGGGGTPPGQGGGAPAPPTGGGE